MRQTHLVAVAMASVLCTSGLVGGAHPRAAQAAGLATVIDAPEAYAVYAAILEMGRDSRYLKATRYVVRREAEIDRSCALVGEPEDPAWRSVMASFTAANAESHVLLEGFSLGLPYSVVPREEIYGLFTPAELGWPRFYERYPGVGGYEGMSAVGFDANQTLALVYMENHCGSLCGDGSTRFLRKEDGRWRVTAVAGITHCQWVS